MKSKRFSIFFSLAVRDVSNLVKPDDIITSEHLVTLIAVIPTYSQKDWLASYETLTNFVVRRTIILLYFGNFFDCLSIFYQRISILAIIDHNWCLIMLNLHRYRGPQRSCTRTMSMLFTPSPYLVELQIILKPVLVKRDFRYCDI